ncbi:MAG: hypothetical protein IPH76_07090 [Xanthomonadales bacterium]|nr:hypothetical protein [Xanthomonadales bacterium]
MNAQHAIHFHSDEHGAPVRDADSPLLQVYRSGESVARIETVFPGRRTGRLPKLKCRCCR